MKTKLPIIILSLALLIFNLSLISAVGTYPSVDPNMVLYYHFNNDSSVGESYGVNNVTYDYSNAKNNGTYYNATWNNTGGYLGDGGFEFDGVKNNSINITNSPSLQFNSTGEISVGLWFKVANPSKATTEMLISKHISGTSGSFFMTAFNTTKNLMRFVVLNSSGSQLHAESTRVINDSNWHYIIGTASNNTKVVQIYIDGTLAANYSNPTLNTIKEQNTPIRIGSLVGTTPQNFNGSMDEIIFWNKSLNANEVRDLYNIYHGCFNLTEGLEIEFTTPICKNNYSLNNSAIGSGVKFSGDNILLDLNGAILSGNSSAYLLYSNVNDNITITNGTFIGGYQSIRVVSSSNVNINNINFSDSSSLAIYGSNATNITINKVSGNNLNAFITLTGSDNQNLSNNILTNSRYGILAQLSDNLIYNNNSFFNTSRNYDIEVGLNSTNVNITNNIYNITDGGIVLYSNVTNFLIQGNNISNCIGGYDGYTACIRLSGKSSNGIIQNNTLGYGTNQIYIGQSSGNNNNIIRWNTFNTGTINQRLSAFQLVNGINSNDGFEPYCSIVMTQVIRTWTCQNYTTCSLLTSNNISIYNNTYDSNTQCYIRSQGITNLSINETWYNTNNFWFNSWKLRDFTDYDNMYLSNNFNTIQNINKSYNISSILGQGSQIANYNNTNITTWYTISKSYNYFKDNNNLLYRFFNYSINNLSSPLISFSNGSSIYQSGTNLEYNLSLQLNNYVYVYEDLGDLELRRCNATVNFTILNFTFMDERNNSIKLNGTISQASFTYFADGLPQNITKNYNFTSSESNITFPICINPSDRNYWINYSIVYNGNGGYLERTQSSNYVLFSNITNNIQLSLLNTTNIVTFQLINSLSQTINSAYVYVLPYLNDTILASGYTDSGGIIQFLLQNGTTYRIYFSKSGYDSYSTLLNPTETFYTITLSGTGLAVVTPPDYTGGNPAIPNSVGVTYSTKPQNTWLNNGTYYNFNLTINSGTWNLTNWGFNLTDQSSNLINATSSTNASGGTLNINASTSNYTRVIMNFYYTINGTTINLQRVWLVLDLSDNTYSISHAIDDATNYINSGLFGITTRGLSFIVFFIIFIGAGILSFKFGLTSPVAICGFVFAMIWLFDVSLGWIPNPVSAVPHFATILIGITFLGFIVREVSQ